ncbi:N,N'-diacetylchitobiose transport system permease protein [Streptomyces zhaozhouensis]|uniref:N,N'-diacetylchitobiose transport system permease protein n=1 Tax=Streptomyces zhaozhouensis TaxID=1300267 RepID=A0A286DIH2_9ACTN|nr:carbohydrate ABC transporter permease [Streptomyces zhaozhouensis]SOD58522.1 N,N'-diacetylchitobiose transport system permease protein [Streptomyces zhaozhouensis]
MNRTGPWRRLGLGTAVAALLAFTLFPVYWMVSSAFDPGADHRGAAVLPEGVTLDHFRHVLDEGDFGRYLVNSALVGLGTVLLAGLLALFAAVAVARFRFRMRTKVLVMVLIVQMVPLEALVIPLFLQMRDLRMLNSLLGLTVVYLAFSLPFAIWTLRGFVAAVPRELEEAAYLDGCGWWRMFRSVLLPLVAPGLVATSVFAFIVAWNEFVFAFVFLQDDGKYTAAVGLHRFFGQYSTDWGAVMAGSTLITLPVLLFFVAVQRRLSAGLAAGALR